MGVILRLGGLMLVAVLGLLTGTAGAQTAVAPGVAETVRLPVSISIEVMAAARPAAEGLQLAIRVRCADSLALARLRLSLRTVGIVQLQSKTATPSVPGCKGEPLRVPLRLSAAGEGQLHAAVELRDAAGGLLGAPSADLYVIRVGNEVITSQSSGQSAWKTWLDRQRSSRKIDDSRYQRWLRQLYEQGRPDLDESLTAP